MLKGKTAIVTGSTSGIGLGIARAPGQPLEIVDVYAVVLKEFDDFHYAGEVDNFQFIEKGQTFAIQNGQPLTVSEDSYLLIPMRPEATRLREEVCYLGRRIGTA